MKNWIKLNLLGLVLLSVLTSQAQVAVSTDGSSADASAMLEVKSINKGLLIPRMTQTQKNSIINPAKGLLIYQTDGDQGIYSNIGTSTSPDWRLLSYNPITEIVDVDFDTKIQVEESSDEDIIRFDIGGNEKVVINGNGNIGVGESSPSEKIDVNGNVKATAFYDKDNPSYYLNLNSLGNALILNGKAGIGTISPSYKLDVVGDINFTGTLYQNGTPFTGGSTLTGSGNYGQIAVWSSTSNLTSESNLFWDFSNNRLGVNNSSPDYRLDVNGDAGFNDYLYHNGDPNTYFKFNSDEIYITAGGQSMGRFDGYDDQVVLQSSNINFIANSEYNYIKIEKKGTYNSILRPTGNSCYLGDVNNKWSYIYGVHGYFDISKTKMSFELVTNNENKQQVKTDFNVIAKIKKLDIIRIETNDTPNGLSTFSTKEFLKEFPDLTLKSGDQFYISYTRMVPVLVEAIQQQQQLIEELQKQIEVLQDKL